LEESEEDGDSDAGWSPGVHQPVVAEAGAWGGGNRTAGDAVWAAQLARLAAHKTVHGDCDVPQGWAEDQRLGNWVNSQRVYKRKLDRGEPSKGMTAERVARLTELDFVWEPGLKGGVVGGRPNEAEWEVQLARLVAYKAVHSDCNVPRGWAEDPRLGGWVHHQRQRKRKLDHGEPSAGMTAERAARLTALGLVWDGSKAHPKDAAWEVQLARLAAYKAAHGDCKVPRRWAEDPRLGSWVCTQRQLKRKLDRGEPSEGMTAERTARLEALGFAWNLNRRRG
jgi:predicted secreted Zn-dependent protease